MTQRDDDDPKAARLARNLWRLAKRRAVHAFRLQKGLAMPANANAPVAGMDKKGGDQPRPGRDDHDENPQSIKDLVAKIAEELEDEPESDIGGSESPDKPPKNR